MRDRKFTYFCSILLFGFLLFCFALILTRPPSQDWQGLEEYMDANAALPAPGPDEERVVFMGDSITIKWLRAVPNFFEGKPYINRGIGGQTTAQMLLRFRQDVVDLKPKVVLILAGTNDIAGNGGPMTPEQTMENIESMVRLAQAHDIEPVLCSVLPALEYSWRLGQDPQRKIPVLNAMIHGFAKDEGLIYLDYYSAMVNSENGLDRSLAEDGVHPTPKGYQILGDLRKKLWLKR